jgi:hypothetical protein
LAQIEVIGKAERLKDTRERNAKPGDRESEEMLGTGKESVWVWECVGRERVQGFKREKLKC